MSAEVLSEERGPALVLTLSNPGFKNALAPEMYEALRAGLMRAAASAEIRAVILTGADGAFCAGGNLNRLRANRSQDPRVQSASIGELHQFVRALAACPKPVIAAVEGPAAGAGCSIAFNCDFIVAARTAKFVMAYVKVGLSPDGGGSWQAMRALPRPVASAMLLAGEAQAAPRLMELGVVSRLVEEGQALAQALALAHELAGLSGHAHAEIKELMRTALVQSLDQQLDAERDAFVRCLFHPDAGEAIEAFLGRRKSEGKT